MSEAKGFFIEKFWNLGNVDKTMEIYKRIPSFDITEISMQGVTKFAFCYYSMRKYNKVLSTYIDGMITDTARYCAPYDENGVGTKRWEGSGKCWKSFPHYDVCQKKSKLDLYQEPSFPNTKIRQQYLP